MVPIRLLTKRAMVASMIPCVGTCTIHLMHKRRKSSRHVAGVLTVRLVGKVMILTNVDGVTVVPAVVSVIAERLHAKLLALTNVVGSYTSPIHRSFDSLEPICSGWHTLFRLK